MVDFSTTQGILLFLGIYVVLYFVFAFLKSYNERLDRLIFCPVCGSWFTHLIIGLVLNYSITILAFQIGLSATGLAYYLKVNVFNKEKAFILDFFILQMIVTAIGIFLIKKLGGIS